MSWSEYCGTVVAFLQHISDIRLRYCPLTVVAQISHFEGVSCIDRKSMLVL